MADGGLQGAVWLLVYSSWVRRVGEGRLSKGCLIAGTNRGRKWFFVDKNPLKTGGKMVKNGFDNGFFHAEGDGT